MRHLMIAAALAAFIGSTAGAVAASQTEGTVQSVNATSGTLVLDTGETFTFANSLVLRGILPGQPIAVTYRGQGQGVGAFNPHREAHDNNDSN
ncbi:DUF1344 domain-containing protein [Kaistia dalseonensis]|uniref:DUF1344 domain-containing protein n=1 Tax=Kaistia dalseonensis TaxID=410840 RepID=A0ABU0HCH5_9HYPH|nr:DUF1344 domain-containing protein [Kaistia dalseonensis]MCX5497378.1 DUF1344 domain-containing protein [Kaistia dalseonensis]MDQ0440017.1 hypothetical protein [Kaistia dalseonensis]